MKKKLTWSLAIPTYKRQQMLLKAVACALRQTRPPMQIIICDSGDDRLVNESKVKSLMEGRPDCHLLYIHSPIAQQTVQRNLALQAVTSDVVFCFDDDTLFSEDAAERIVNYFEFDTESKLVGLDPADIDPFTAANLFNVDASAPSATANKRKDWLYKLTQRWVDPYPYAMTITHSAPADLGYESIRFIEGYKIVARTEVIKEIKFDENFINNWGEDADVTYRLSRAGAIVKITDKVVFHAFENRPDANGRRSAFYRFGALMNSSYRSRRYFGEGFWVRAYSIIVWFRFMVLDLAGFAKSRNASRLKGTLASFSSLLRLASTSQNRIGEVLREETIKFKSHLT